MTTFFITYSTGEYDSYWEHVYSIDAESKEALLQEVELAFDAFVDYQAKRSAAHKEIHSRRDSMSSEEYLAKCQEFEEKYPYLSGLDVFGYSIAMFDNIMTSDKDVAISAAGLEIHTIDEYIEYCRPEKST